MTKDESRRIPDLRREGTITVQVFFRERNVGSRSALPREGEAHRIRSKPVADFDRVHDVPFRLRHLLPFGITNETRDVDGLEWNVVHELQAEHHHSRDPE